MKRLSLALSLLTLPASLAEHCSYEMVTNDLRANARGQYLDSLYCSTDHIDVGNIPESYDKRQRNMKAVTPSDVYCGTYKSLWGGVNATMVVAPIGGGWVMVSARVMRDCLSLVKTPTVMAAGNMPNGKLGDMDGFEQLAIFNECWQSCTYRTAPASPGYIPSAFPILMTPFAAQAVPISELAQFGGFITGFAEVAANFALMTVVTYSSLPDFMACDALNTNAIMIAAHLEYMPASFSEMVLSSECSVLTKMANIGSAGAPEIVCGDTVVGSADIFESINSGLAIPGSLWGEPIEGDGCAPTFITGYIFGYNTTETGEEDLAEKVALQLTNPGFEARDGKSGRRLEELAVPPFVGAFEELAGAVCPHAGVVYSATSQGVKIEQAYAAWASDLGYDSAAEACSATTAAGAFVFDESSSRYLLDTTDEFQFRSPSMYMPSEFEVYLYNAIMAAGTRDAYFSKKLNIVRLMYRANLAVVKADAEILSFNDKTLSAQTCEDDPASINLGSYETAVGTTEEEMCAELAGLEAISNGCVTCAKPNSNEASIVPLKMTDCAACREEIELKIVKLATLCASESCATEIFRDYFCDEVSAEIGIECRTLDVVYYYSTLNAASAVEFDAELLYGGSSGFADWFMSEGVVDALKIDQYGASGIGAYLYNGNVFDTYFGYSYASYGFVSHYSTMYSTTQTFSITGATAAFSGGGCYDTCKYSRDQTCDDGGEDSRYALCDIGTDCTDCGERKATKQVEKHYDLEETGCKNTCKYSNDGDCDDGGAGSSYDFCDIGTDCADCGKGRVTLEDTFRFERESEPLMNALYSHRGRRLGEAKPDSSMLSTGRRLSASFYCPSHVCLDNIALVSSSVIDFHSSRVGTDKARYAKGQVTVASAAVKAMYPDGRTTLMTRGFDLVLLSPTFQESVGEFLSGASDAWGSSGYIPMYPTCDAEFEESITHDAISIKLGVPDPDKYGGSLSGEYSCTSWPSPQGLATYDNSNAEKGQQKLDWTSAIVRGD